MTRAARFFGFTFALSWGAWFAARFAGPPAGRGKAPGSGVLFGALLLVGTFSPAICAMALTAQNEGRAGLAEIWHRIIRGNVGARWYLFAVTYMLFVKLLTALAYRAIEGAWPRFGGESWAIIAVAIVLSTPAQAGEEIGWRGYALPRLADRFGLGGASVILGLVWAAWHLPLFFMPGADKAGQSFPFYVVEVTALSVAIAWLYARTGGSLLLVMLMHSAVNQVVGVVPSPVEGATNVWALSTSLPAWLTAAFLWAGAAYFLTHMPDASVLSAPGASSGVHLRPSATI